MHNPAVSPHRHVKPGVVTWAAGTNRDPGCGRIMDPDLVLGHSQGSDVTMAMQITQFYMVPAAVWPLDTNVAPGSCLDLCHLRGLQRHQEPRTTTQILAAGGL